MTTRTFRFALLVWILFTAISLLYTGLWVNFWLGPEISLTDFGAPGIFTST